MKLEIDTEKELSAYEADALLALVLRSWSFYTEDLLHPVRDNGCIVINSVEQISLCRDTKVKPNLV
jgi:glutathione synthase/RimK-type ligase-like ATP-grasp enzyme